MQSERDGIAIYGQHDDNTLVQIQMVADQPECARAALLADGHKGYNMPIGGVAAYPDHLSPAGVGFDIACGNLAVQLNVSRDEIQGELPRLADAIFAELEFGIGRKNATSVEHALFDDSAWQEVPFLRESPGLLQKARAQLGTIGSGNHYVDVFADENDHVWVGVHFGSRGFGHTIASHFIREAGANPNGNMDLPPALLPVESQAGQDYLRCMWLAGRYAYAGRDWVCEQVARILGATIQQEVHNHHNFAWQEEVDGRDMWVVRKGATPAQPGQLGFVGGSMGENSVILRGKDSPAAQALMYSTVHGAGRVLSRTAAAGKMNYKTRTRQGGQVTPDMMHEWVRNAGVELRGAGCDESPHCYKRLEEVLAFHHETITLVHILTPLIVCMAGPDEHDPYKD